MHYATEPHGRRLSSPFGPSPLKRLLWPLLTSRSGSSPLAFQPQNEISPGKNALLRCTTAEFTPLRLDHKSFAASCPLALLSGAFYPVLVHRLAASIHASFPQSVTLMQLRFSSFAVINSRRDFHPQECAHAGRTKKRGHNVPSLVFEWEAAFTEWEAGRLRAARRAGALPRNASFPGDHPSSIPAGGSSVPDPGKSDRDC